MYVKTLKVAPQVFLSGCMRDPMVQQIGRCCL